MPSIMPIDASGSVRESGVVIIRPVIEADLPAIVDIHAYHVRTGTASFEVDAPDLAEMTRRLHALREAGVPYVVAEVDDMLFGYAYAGPHHVRPVYRHMVEDSTYFDTAAQRRGVGMLLLEALTREYQMRDFKQMVVVVGSGHENPESAKLYACCGFREVGVLETVGHKFRH